MTHLNRTRHLGETLLIAVGADVTNPIAEFHRSVAHGAEDQLSFGAVIAAAPEYCSGFDDDDFLPRIVGQEMVAKLIPEYPKRCCRHVGILAGISATSTFSISFASRSEPPYHPPNGSNCSAG